MSKVKLTPEQENAKFTQLVTDRAVEQIERALLSVIAVSHQLNQWIDYDKLIQRAKDNVATEAADVWKAIP